MAGTDQPAADSTDTPAHLRICGAVTPQGPNGEPLACAYRAQHPGQHSWGGLDTWKPPSTPGRRDPRHAPPL